MGAGWTGIGIGCGDFTGADAGAELVGACSSTEPEADLDA